MNSINMYIIPIVKPQLHTQCIVIPIVYTHIWSNMVKTYRLLPLGETPHPFTNDLKGDQPWVPWLFIQHVEMTGGILWGSQKPCPWLLPCPHDVSESSMTFGKPWLFTMGFKWDFTKKNGDLLGFNGIYPAW